MITPPSTTQLAASLAAQLNALTGNDPTSERVIAAGDELGLRLGTGLDDLIEWFVEWPREEIEAILAEGVGLGEEECLALRDPTGLSLNLYGTGVLAVVDYDEDGPETLASVALARRVKA